MHFGTRRFSLSNKDKQKYGFERYGSTPQPTPEPVRTSSLSLSGQAAAAALRKHSPITPQPQTTQRPPRQSRTFSMSSNGPTPAKSQSYRSNSLASYTYNPGGSYVPSAYQNFQRTHSINSSTRPMAPPSPSTNIKPANRSNSLSSNALRTNSLRNNSIRTNSLTSMNKRASNGGARLNSMSSGSGEVTTVKTTKITDEHGRTRSIKTQTVKRLNNGYNLIETTTQTIQEAGGSFTGSLHDLNSIQEEESLDLTHIDATLHDFDDYYEVSGRNSLTSSSNDKMLANSDIYSHEGRQMSPKKSKSILKKTTSPPRDAYSSPIEEQINKAAKVSKLDSISDEDFVDASDILSQEQIQQKSLQLQQQLLDEEEEQRELQRLYEIQERHKQEQAQRAFLQQQQQQTPQQHHYHQFLRESPIERNQRQSYIPQAVPYQQQEVRTPKQSPKQPQYSQFGGSPNYKEKESPELQGNIKFSNVVEHIPITNHYHTDEEEALDTTYDQGHEDEEELYDEQPQESEAYDEEAMYNKAYEIAYQKVFGKTEGGSAAANGYEYKNHYQDFKKYSLREEREDKKAAAKEKKEAKEKEREARELEKEREREAREQEKEREREAREQEKERERERDRMAKEQEREKKEAKEKDKPKRRLRLLALGRDKSSKGEAAVVIPESIGGTENNSLESYVNVNVNNIRSSGEEAVNAIPGGVSSVKEVLHSAENSPRDKMDQGAEIESVKAKVSADETPVSVMDSNVNDVEVNDTVDEIYGTYGDYGGKETNNDYGMDTNERVEEAQNDVTHEYNTTLVQPIKDVKHLAESSGPENLPLRAAVEDEKPKKKGKSRSSFKDKFFKYFINK